MPATWTVIVLAGGRSSRLGSDKAQATIDGRRLVDHVLVDIPDEVEVIVVGPDPKSKARSYVVTRELSAGSGPVAAIDAALDKVTTPLVAVVAVDMPFAPPLIHVLIDELTDASASVDAVIPTDSAGREQPLAAAYRTDALRRAAASLGGVENRSVRDLRGALRASLHPVSSPLTLLDVDTPDDLATARRSVPSTRDS